MNDVFISYSHKDFDKARRVYLDLTSRGLDVWMAPGSINPGQRWASAIAAAIQESKVFLLMFNANSSASPQVESEIDLAAKYCDTIIPFRLDATQPAGAMEYYLNRSQWVDAQNNFEQAVDAIAQEIERMLGKAKPSQVRAPEPQPEADRSVSADAVEAQDQIELGNMYYDAGKYDKAAVVYTRALELYTRLASIDPSAYELILAQALNCLAIAQKELSRYDLSEETYMRGITICRRLYAANPNTQNGAVLCKLCNNLAYLYRVMKRYEEEERQRLKVIELREHLFQLDPVTFEETLADAYMRIGRTYRMQIRDPDAEDAYKKAAEIYLSVAAKRPEPEEKLADVYGSLGYIYKDAGRTDEEEAMFLKELALRERTAKREPLRQEPALALVLCDLGALYKRTVRPEQAERMYCRALEIYKRLVRRDTKKYGAALAETYMQLGDTYYDMGDADKSYDIYNEIRENKDAIGYDPNSIEYRMMTARIYAGLGFASCTKKSNRIAEAWLRDAQTGFKKVMTETDYAKGRPEYDRVTRAIKLLQNN